MQAVIIEAQSGKKRRDINYHALEMFDKSHNLRAIKQQLLNANQRF